MIGAGRLAGTVALGFASLILVGSGAPGRRPAGGASVDSRRPITLVPDHEVGPGSAMVSAGRPSPVGVTSSMTASTVAPSRVVIPSIGVDSTLERLGLSDDGSIAAPDDYGEAGWFANGPVPGQPGPAVIAGHVDSRTGPAVFYRLDDLRPGDRVDVVGGDGSTVAFTVTRSALVPKDEFPATEVYGPVPDAELRLISCGGSFDYANGHYRSNVVVYAVLTGGSN